MDYTAEQLRTIDVQIAQALGYTIGIEVIEGKAFWYLCDPQRERVRYLSSLTGPLRADRSTEDEAWYTVSAQVFTPPMRFTTDANAAMRLLKERPSFNLHYDHRQRLWCIWEQKYAPKRKDFYGYAATPALAICQACYPYLFEAV